MNGFNSRRRSSRFRFLEEIDRRWVHRPIAVFVERFAEHRFILACQSEERHRRPELQVIGRAKYLLQRSTGNSHHGLYAAPEAKPKHGMLQIGLGFGK